MPFTLKQISYEHINYFKIRFIIISQGYRLRRIFLGYMKKYLTDTLEIVKVTITESLLFRQKR